MEDRRDAPAGTGGAPEAWGPLAEALRAYRRGADDAAVRVRSDLGADHDLPARLLFGEGADLPEVERRAVEEARGRVLDVGAGVGRHALLLRDRGLDVTVLEPVEAAAEILDERGLGPVVRRPILDVVESARAGGGGDAAHDTILLLMNGAGVLGTLAGLDRFLAGADALLAAGGSVLLDSTDVRPSPPPDADGGAGPEPGLPRRADGRYVGEAHLQLEFEERRGAPFPYLYVDSETLGRRARRAGWGSEVVCRGEGGRYLARLVPGG